MAARWIAAAIAATTFVIVGFFVVVAFVAPFDNTTSADRPATGATVAGRATTDRIGRFIVTAATVVRSGEAEIVLSIRDDRGENAVLREPPAAVLRMDGMGMAARLVAVQQQSSGDWRGSGRPAMPGSWKFVVTIEGEQITVPIEVP